MKKPYLGFSREEVDRQYRVTGNIKGLEDIFQSFVDDSEKFRANNPCHLGISYGPSTDEVLDIFHSEKKLSPVHIFLHGGYWHKFSKNEWSFLAEGLTQNNVMFVVPNYSLCPKFSLTEIVRQMRACISWVYNNIEQYGGDPNRIFISGHSAGGHLAVMLLLTNWVKDYGLPEDVIKGALSISGIFDLAPVQKSYLQEFIQISDKEVKTLSPELHIKDIDVPLSLFVGGEETDEFIRQTKEFSEDWNAHGNRASDHVMPAHNHLSILNEFSEPDGKMCQMVLKQMA